MVLKLLLLAVAGAAGTLARYGLTGLVQRWVGSGFPLGTATANILGSFLFGLIWTISTERGYLGAETRLIILTGFMGAFTTFSTYMFESGQMIRDGQIGLYALNTLGQIAIGTVALFLGFAAGRLL